MVLLTYTFRQFYDSFVIINEFIEEDGFEADAQEVWAELEAEFNDAGVYDRS